ncbi:MAG: transposase [bacterium]
MARPLRIEYPGAIYHITARGNAKRSIYYNDSDRKEFLRILEKTIKRYKWLCHSYNLMTNHYHLLVETPEGNLSGGMRQLNGVYTQRFNKMHSRVGHLFQGRYKAIVVQKNEHLLELSRYIVLNSVRAGIVKRVEDWKWSAYRAMLGLEECPDWLTTDWILKQFDNNQKKGVEKYYKFVKEGVGKTVWEKLKGQIYYGDDKFIKKISKKERIKEIPRIQQEPKRKPLRVILRKNSDNAIVEAYEKYRYCMKEIAEYLGVHYATVSRRLRRIEKMYDCKT